MIFFSITSFAVNTNENQDNQKQSKEIIPIENVSLRINENSLKDESIKEDVCCQSYSENVCCGSVELTISNTSCGPNCNIAYIMAYTAVQAGITILKKGCEQ